MDAGIWTAIAAGGPAVLVIALLLIYGVPKWLEVNNAQSARDKEIQKVAAELAKEGPTMLIAELRLDVAELKAEVNALRAENKGLLEDRRRCESEQFEQKVMIAGLKQQNAEQAKRIAELESKSVRVEAEVKGMQVEQSKLFPPKQAG